MDITQAFQARLRCRICLTTLIDPVTIVCGHTFCRPCLCLAWEKAQIPAKCPVCRSPSKRTNLKTDIMMKHLVSIARKAHLQQFLSSEEHRCETHQELKQVFCEVETKLLCKLCSRSPEHQAHRHSAIEEAAEAHREMILKQMTSLWDKIQENQRNIREESVKVRQWIRFMDSYMRLINNICEMLLPKWKGDEKRISEILTSEKNWTLKKLKKGVTQMCRKKTHLKKMYQELIRTYQNPDMKLLMHWKYTRTRYAFSLCLMPQPMNPKLRAVHIPGLRDELDHYGVEISFSQQTQNPGMMLFEDVKKLTDSDEEDHEDDDDDDVLNSDGSTCSTAWGVQAFSFGKYYWELSVDDSKDWAVGVCRNSRLRKDPIRIQSSDVFLLLCLKGYQDADLFTTSPLLPQFIERPVGRVGVFLDFEDGSLSFVNVAKGSFIWKYPPGTLQFSVRPFCCTGPEVPDVEVRPHFTT